ncbi:hypothetical protein HYH03_017223, partial [Edaphochlamys debaryana]
MHSQHGSAGGDASGPPDAPRAASRSASRGFARSVTGRRVSSAVRRADTLAILNAATMARSYGDAASDGSDIGAGAGAGGGGAAGGATGGGEGKGPRTQLAFLQRLADRLKRVGLTFPGVEVRWSDLEVEVTAPPQGPAARTLLSALSAGATALADSATAPCRPSASAACPPTRRTVLSAGSGRLGPGRMTLLLGPPGAGKTTLLRVLAGQALPGRETHGVRVRGVLSYNGLEPGSDFVVERCACYVGQYDTHMGELTVADTMTFAAKCLGPGLNEELHRRLLAAEKAAGIAPDPELDALWGAAYGPDRHTLMVELFARLLGIDHVMGTVVGNDMLKGISGGQKRRVTVGEMAVGLANVMMLDEVTNGLDSNSDEVTNGLDSNSDEVTNGLDSNSDEDEVTNGLDSNSALAMVRALRNICSYAQATMLVSLLQPSPEVWECFDDVCLLAGGRLVFLGGRREAMGFFGGLGLAPPITRTDADFLQEVISSASYQNKYRVGPAPPDPWAAERGEAERRWLGPARLREEFDRSAPGQSLAAALALPPATHPLQGLVLHKEPYALSYGAMWLTVLWRELKLFFANKAFFAAGASQTIFTAFLVSTTFIRMSTDTFKDANLFLSVIFFSLMTLFMGGFNFCPVYCQRLPVFYKHRDHRLISPAAYTFACAAMRLPELLLQASLWAVMVYFSAGFAADAGRFFIFWLNLVAAGFYSVALFQLLGAVARHEVIAQGLGAVLLMMSVMGSGFPIARTSIPGWWIWWYWIDPMAWSLRSMAICELTSSAWSDPAEEYDEPDTSIGIYALTERGFYTEWGWVWAGIGTVAGLSLLLLGAQVLALTYLGPLSGYRPPVEDDDTLPSEPTAKSTSAPGHPPSDAKAAAAAAAASRGGVDEGGVPEPEAESPPALGVKGEARDSGSDSSAGAAHER